MPAILLFPAALCFTSGRLVGDLRQGRAVWAAMTIISVGMARFAVWAEQRGNPAPARLGVNQAASDVQSGGNMEGKESRFGVVNSVLRATATTAGPCFVRNMGDTVRNQ